VLSAVAHAWPLEAFCCEVSSTCEGGGATAARAAAAVTWSVVLAALGAPILALHMWLFSLLCTDTLQLCIAGAQLAFTWVPSTSAL
jgi:hypothetical protein